MKMKTVCEQTGLSDRAVRFYMEEHLIAPSYTENYLGRRAYDFSETNVQDLRDIAVLRKFGFSIENIRQLKEEPGSSTEVLAQLRAQKQKTVEEEQAALNILNRLDDSKIYGISELAQALSVPAEVRKLPPEDQEDRLGRRRKLRMLAVFAVAVAPVLLPWFWFNWGISHWSGLAMTRGLFSAGCVLALCQLICATECQAVLLRLAGAILVLADYVLAFVCFQERANISGVIDLATSMRVSHWTYWLACIWLLAFFVRWLVDCISSLIKKE